MISRRDREFPSHKTEPAPFAARAKDLGALRDAVVDAASVGTGLWLSYLFVLFYFAIAAGAVTHRDLLLENPVKLPFLNVELPLKAFFVLGPLVFLIVHTYVLLHFVLLADKVGAFHAELQAQIVGDEARMRLCRQLPSNIFVQSLAGPREVRTGIIGFLLRMIVQISLVAGPIALLVLFQLQFLPYHNEWITTWQRIAVAIDLILLWTLWPPIARGEAILLGWNDFKRSKVLAWLPVSLLPVILMFTIATFPGEWLEKTLPTLSIIPTSWPPWKPQAHQPQPKRWTSLHELLVAGEVDYLTGKPRSLWSNRLVLPKLSSDGVSLRGRSLEGAVLAEAHLRKADFAGAHLQSADLFEADLREAKFMCGNFYRECATAELQGALLNGAKLQGASLIETQLQGALLGGTELEGANLNGAQLQSAYLGGGAAAERLAQPRAAARRRAQWRAAAGRLASECFCLAGQAASERKHSGRACRCARAQSEIWGVCLP